MQYNAAVLCTEIKMQDFLADFALNSESLHPTKVIQNGVQEGGGGCGGG